MRPRLVEVAGVVAMLIAASACGREKAGDVRQQAADSVALAKARSAPTASPAARPAAPSPEALAADELSRAPRVRTVQVSAFEKAGEARWWVGELQKQGIPAYTTTTVVDGQSYTRLRIGAAVSGAEARAIAAKIHARYHWPTWILMVEDKSELPSNALLASRSYAGQ